MCSNVCLFVCMFVFMCGQARACVCVYACMYKCISFAPVLNCMMSIAEVGEP